MTEAPDQAVAWRTSSYSQGGGGNCVEAGPLLDGSRHVAVRDSTRRDAGTFIIGRTAWTDFTAWVTPRF